jgi:hypothetical protein
VKGKDKQVFVPHIKKRIVCTLLNAMSAHKDDDTMMRNGCLTLCQFKIPQDVVGSKFKARDDFVLIDLRAVQTSALNIKKNLEI